MDVCDHRECEKERARSRSTVWFLRRELEAARESIEELEAELARLEDAYLDGVEPVASLPFEQGAAPARTGVLSTTARC